MIRITLLSLLILYLSAYAWKDWFRATCWLVLLMALFQHPDMPKAIWGVAGLNHWNFLFVNVFFSWLLNRKKQHLNWDMPRKINILLFLYSLLIVISVIRYLSDMSGVLELNRLFGVEVLSGIATINEYLINCFKWVLPAMIIFDGCRSKRQYSFALIMTSLMFLLLALQVIKAMKLGSLSMGGDDLQRKALKVIASNVGFHRVNISMMMSGAFWMVFCLKEYLTSRFYWLFIAPACAFIFLAMVMTGGRAGYISWAVVGFIFVVFKWRKYILLTPLILIVVFFYAPSAVDRFTQGMGSKNADMTKIEVDFEEKEVNTYSITSGRIIAWPLVWQSIIEAPYLGYGRDAMKNSGITAQIMIEHGKGESFPHPHNAYLQWLQDNGFIGAIPLLIFYFLIIKYAYSLFREKDKAIYVVTGGICLALVLTFLLASFGSQTFYPREGAVGMWVSIALMLRVYCEREKIINKENSELITENEKIYFFKL